MRKIRRVLNIVLDGCGCGEAPDAAKFGDAGSNTLLHVIEKKNPEIPNLMELGLGSILNLKDAEDPVGCYGRMREKSVGKDTTSGHWEIAGLTLDRRSPPIPTVSRRRSSTSSNTRPAFRSSATSPQAARRSSRNWATSIT